MNFLRRKIIRPFNLFLINHFFKGTHWFGLKRALLCACDIAVGKGTKVVGPIEVGTVADLEIGAECWVGKKLSVDGNGSVAIGDRVDIGPSVTFATGGHRIGSAERRAGSGERYVQRVGDGCWIGTETLFCGGDITVGDSCVMAGGCVVIGDSEANCLLAGVPARVKKKFG